MNPAAGDTASELVHGRLQRWASELRERIALDDGQRTLTFAELQAAVERIRCELDTREAPGVVLLEDDARSLDRVVRFLAIVASGRCAAVADPDWPASARAAVRVSIGEGHVLPERLRPEDPFYIGFTSGSTGRPKGFRRSHSSWTESFRICIETFGADAASRIAAPGRMSHSLFLFGILLGLWSGAGALIQDRFSPELLLRQLYRGDVRCLLLVPSQLVIMLDWAVHHARPPVHDVRLILISGARWSRSRTSEVRNLFPRARIVEFYGSSETSFIAWMDADANAPPGLVGTPFANVELRIRPCPRGGEAGLIYVRSPMVFMDYACTAEDPTAAHRDGSWLSVHDVGKLDGAGRLHLVGRRHRMIVTQGKNLFPEEVEAVLALHPSVVAVSVHGVAHPIRGQEVVAAVKLRPGCDVEASCLARWCRNRLEPFKVPRSFLTCKSWPMTAGGKTDHPCIARLLQSFEASACLRQLP